VHDLHLVRAVSDRAHKPVAPTSRFLITAKMHEG
jgi:hypothetical protein